MRYILLSSFTALSLLSYPAFSMEGIPEHQSKDLVHIKLTLTPEQLEAALQAFPKLPVVQDPTPPEDSSSPLGYGNRSAICSFIKTHFIKDQNGLYQPKEDLKPNQEFLQQAHHFIEIYPLASDLKIMVGRALTQNDGKKDIEDGFSLFTQGLIQLKAQATEDMSFPLSIADAYLRILGYFEYNSGAKTIRCGALLKDLRTLICDPTTYAIQNQMDQKQSRLACKRALLEKFQSLFSIIKACFKDLFPGEATFFCLTSYITAYNNWDPLIPQELGHHLYSTVYKDSALEQIPTIILCKSAEYLFGNKKYKQAILLYKSALKNQEDPFDQPQDLAWTYNMLGNCYSAIQQYDEALNAFQQAIALDLDETIAIKWNATLMGALCGKYTDGSLETMKRVYGFSKEEREQHSIMLPPRIINSTYKIALESAGLKKELKALFLEEQQNAIKKALERRRKQGAGIKATVEEEKRIREQLRLEEEQRQKNRQATKKETTTMPSYEEPSPWESPMGKEKNKDKEPDLPAKKEKLKKEKEILQFVPFDAAEAVRRGKIAVSFIEGAGLFFKIYKKNAELIEPSDEENFNTACLDRIVSAMMNAQESRTDPEISPEDKGALLNYIYGRIALKEKKEKKVTDPQSPKQNRDFTQIEELTTNKNAQETFYKLFSFHQRGNCFDNAVKISHFEIQSLFDAFGMDFDSSRGKGSHKKGSIDATDAGGTEKSVIHLTKSTYLKPYLIKKTRKAFLRAGIAPNDEATVARLMLDYPQFFE